MSAADDGIKAQTTIIPENESIIEKLGKSPYPAWIMSGLCLSSIPVAAKSTLGMPSVFQCSAFGLIFAGAGDFKDI
ncbi:8719_t:CDS:2 [Entrophospora sp. SA101]|nr:11153_t:CDS:2 [Entrophospora sp. SA101]CAJ0832199.1 10913_t:CDS:2 [Entrophospora sp. SA101]CAJ0888274.1 8719_t:CDS:2 [Entrophospora sp. SA101]